MAGASSRWIGLAKSGAAAPLASYPELADESLAFDAALSSDSARAAIVWDQDSGGDKGGITVAVGGHLNNPLGLTIAPNNDILTANANDGNIVETRPSGTEFPPLDTGAGAGGLFGLTLAPDHEGVYFVDDANNTLGLLH